MLNLKLHHIGCVVDSIDSRAQAYMSTLGSATLSPVFHDPIQKSRVAFLDLPTPGAVQFELIEPATPDSPVARFLERGGGLHHLCYEVDDLQDHIQRMKKDRAVLIRSPQPAVAFGGRQIAWLRTRDALLIELLEAARAVSGQKVGPVAAQEEAVVIAKLEPKR